MASDEEYRKVSTVKGWTHDSIRLAKDRKCKKPFI